MRQTLRPDAATIRPGLRAFLALLAFLSFFPGAARADSFASRRESAKSQFDRAEKERLTLEARPEKDRSLKDYSSLVTAYRRVYLITPRAAEVPTAMNEVAVLYRAMGDLFDVKYYQLAVNSYQFLLRQYPASRYREDAMLAIGQIEQNDLHDAVLAQKSYQEFLTLHPRSSHAAEVRAILEKLGSADAAARPAAKISAAKNAPSTKAVVDEKAPPATDTKRDANGENNTASGSSPQVTRVRTWNADTYTRIVIDVGADVKYQAARISGPDRIYFDLEGAKINPELLHRPIPVEGGGYLKAVRVAQNQLGVVRVVLEVDRAKDYSVFLLPDPYRLVVDVYGSSAAAEEAARATSPAPGPTTEPLPAKPENPAREAAAKTPVKTPETVVSNSATTPNAGTESSPTGNVTFKSSSSVPKSRKGAAPKISAKAADGTPSKPVVTSPANEQPAQNGKTVATSASSAPLPQQESVSKTATKTKDKAASKPASVPVKVQPTQSDKDVESASLAPVGPGSNPDAPPLATRPASARTKSVRPTKSAHDQAEEMGPPSVPEPTHDGQQSLTRALGLKIGRIVIDPGHGGHDTGTIGPTGLMEKDLCLDVALRVGKLIQQRLPSAEVVYTREDDTFIPLEQRTEIANEARADLFLSVHANSSPDRKARGIETYYLNFTASSDAMEVATRENTLSGNAVHDLQDIVNKIARNEKIEESRDFAGTIQDSLAKRVENSNRGDRSRGVRKAPFVVLIGANMPSVLAEISFISNPSDEQWLKKPENRQRVAEGLYRGIETYLQNTNSLTLDQAHSGPATRAGILARSGNPQ
jgi:N-acetylmuramoyl-L-alanine amidase